MKHLLTKIYYSEEGACEPSDCISKSSYNSLNDLLMDVHNHIKGQISDMIHGETYLTGNGERVYEKDIDEIIRLDKKITNDANTIKVVHNDHSVNYRSYNSYGENANIYVFHPIDQYFYTIKIKRDIFRWSSQRYSVLEKFSSREEQQGWLVDNILKVVDSLGKFNHKLLLPETVKEITYAIQNSKPFLNDDDDSVHIEHIGDNIIVVTSYIVSTSGDRHTILEYMY